MEFGKLSKVDLREGWKHEAYDFTTWLAKEENLKLLGDAIDIELEMVETEASVGKYNSDILAKEANSEKVVLIENQLEPTDHDHLGKLITYASGHEAKMIIWICKRVNDEHKSAIEWLNRKTDEDTHFFAIELELWKIGESLSAPHFKIIESPNDWAKTIKQAVKNEQLTETKLAQLNYWKEFQDFATKKGSVLSFRKARPRHWYNFSLGSSHAHVTLTVDSRKNLITCGVYINSSKFDPKSIMDKLEERKEEIESDLGIESGWYRMNKFCQVKIEKKADFTDEDDQKQQFTWLIENAEKFAKVFNKWLKTIDLEENENE
ncbi:DUF4268 domain-containing protein [Candidatus Woesearchaeota archaeon]|nr:DUF4268 domain-containing protein [Candidatus Woesearchaeota archaeon]